jgi:macrolide-specific efflux system membrane fusion protein
VKKLFVFGALAAVLLFAVLPFLRQKPAQNRLAVVPVARRDIVWTIKATGTIEPRDLVPVRAPVTGRVEKLESDQGDRINQGGRLAVMSSSERAAVLDQALTEGPAAYAKWSQFYKATPVVAPVGGLVISREAVPGQTVRAGDALFTIADELIVRASVDEADIARIKPGQKAVVRTDSFPDQPFEAVVEKVGLQAKQVEGVSTYTVELRPKGAPADLKTGMTAEVAFEAQRKDKVLALPVAAVQGRENAKLKLPVLDSPKAAPTVREIQLGISDGKAVEVVAGVPEGGAILVPEPDFKAEAPLRKTR